MKRLGWRRKFPEPESPLYKEHRLRYEAGALLIELSQQVGMTPRSYKDAALLEGWRRPVRGITASEKPQYKNPPRFKGERLILTDAQVPFHNASFINKCIDLALTWGIKNCLCAGDIFDVTAFAGEKYHTRPADTFKVELSEGRKFVKAISDVMDLDLLTGNHEKRFRHYMREQLMAEDFLLLLKGDANVTFSDYGFCLLENWLVGHPRNVSVIPGRIPFFMSRKFPTYNVALGHGHLQALMMAEDGKRIVVDIGSCADFSKLDWVALDINTKPAMVTGALILKRNEETGKLSPHLLWEWSPWKQLAKMAP